jgi:hypothetical protein
MRKIFILTVSVLLLFTYGCINDSINKESKNKFNVSVGDEIVLKHLLNGGDISVASSKEIFNAVISELESNRGNNPADLTFDMLEKYMYSGDYFTLMDGIRVIIAEIEGEYAKVRILDGRHIDKVVWTYTRYLRMCIGDN